MNLWKCDWGLTVACQWLLADWYSWSFDSLVLFYKVQHVNITFFYLLGQVLIIFSWNGVLEAAVCRTWHQPRFVVFTIFCNIIHFVYQSYLSENISQRYSSCTSNISLHVEAYWILCRCQSCINCWSPCLLVRTCILLYVL